MSRDQFIDIARNTKTWGGDTYSHADPRDASRQYAERGIRAS